MDRMCGHIKRLGNVYRFRGRRQVHLALLLILLLSACGGSTPAEVGVSGGNGLPAPTATLFIMALSRVTPTPTLEATRTPKPKKSFPTTLPPTPTDTPTHTPTITPTSTAVFRLCSPLVANSIEELPKIVSDPYDPPKSWGSDERHHGVDLAYHRWKESDSSILGVGVQSVLAGRVSAALADTYPFGNLVIVETRREALPQALVDALEIPLDRSLYLLYAHLDGPPLVGLGDDLPACHLLGAVGRSGNTQVAHLHLETRLGPPGATFTGLSRFVEDATEEEKANYNLWRISGTFRHFDPMSLLLFQFESGG